MFLLLLKEVTNKLMFWLHLKGSRALMFNPNPLDGSNETE
jgi:hypothetical protein